MQHARYGSIVVAIIDSEFTVKALYNASGYVKLKSESLTYPGIVLKENQKLEICDMVESCTRKRPALLITAKSLTLDTLFSSEGA